MSKPASRKAQAHILLLEDDESCRESFTEAFHSENYNVTAVVNGVKALAFLSKAHAHVDLIFSDTNMPVMDGFGFRMMQLANESFAKIPTILYSADPNNRSKATALGLVFIAKPFDLDFAFSEIDRLVGGYRTSTPNLPTEVV